MQLLRFKSVSVSQEVAEAVAIAADKTIVKVVAAVSFEASNILSFLHHDEIIINSFVVSTEVCLRMG